MKMMMCTLRQDIDDVKRRPVFVTVRADKPTESISQHVLRKEDKKRTETLGEKDIKRAMSSMIGRWRLSSMKRVQGRSTSTVVGCLPCFNTTCTYHPPCNSLNFEAVLHHF